MNFTAENLEETISAMVSSSPTREQHEALFFSILDSSPFFVIEYLLQATIVSTNQCIIHRNLVIIYRIIREHEILLSLDHERCNLLEKLMKELFVMDVINVDLRKVVEDVFTGITLLFFKIGLWQDVIGFLCECIAGSNQINVISAIEVLKNYICEHVFDEISADLMNSFNMVFNVFAENDEFTKLSLSTIKLIRGLYMIYKIEDMKIFAPKICKLMRIVPHNLCFSLISTISSFNYIYFIDVFDEYVQSILWIMNDNSNNEGARIRGMYIILDIYSEKYQVIENFSKNIILETIESINMDVKNGNFSLAMNFLELLDSIINEIDSGYDIVKFLHALPKVPLNHCIPGSLDLPALPPWNPAQSAVHGTQMVPGFRYSDEVPSRRGVPFLWPHPVPGLSRHNIHHVIYLIFQTFSSSSSS